MTLPFVISIPHCGARVPEEIRPALALNDRQIEESVDFGTAEIFGGLPVLHVVQADLSRLVVDLNRAPDQTDPKGVAALTDYHGRRIYRKDAEPDQKTIARRVDRFHRPYHRQLARVLSDPKVMALIDGHSLNGTGPADAPDPGKRRKDIVISNNGDLEGLPRPGFGPVSCDRTHLMRFKEAFEQQGFTVSLNAPYHGGYIVRHFGRSLVEANRFAVQIELNQDLYMRPGSLSPEANRVASVRRLVLAALEIMAAEVTSGDTV